MTATVERPPIGLSTKLLYGVGAVANAVKLRGLATFLMIFYNQVVGLPPAKVATVLMIALVVDALVDPMVGQFSDNFRSRWGRRHPFMYAAAVPVSVAFFLLWNPPQDWSEQAIFAYMIACLLTIRVCDTLFELPHSALAPELAKDYNERTGLISIRMLFAVAGGLGMTVLAYQVFLKENPDGTGGVLARDGYFLYSLVAALTIFTVIIVSSLGTHNQIPHLRAPPKRNPTLGGMLREVGQSLNNRAFIIATLTGMFIAVAAGSKNGLELYFALYFFELTQSQLSMITVLSVVGSLAGVSIAPMVSRALGKKRGAIIMFAGALAVGITPVSLRLLGLLPPNGTEALFLIICAETLLNTAMAAATGVLLLSMTIDIVEDVEVKTGRRSEGLLMSADNLFKKMVSGVGVFIAGAVLQAIEFPDNAQRGRVDPEILQSMGLIYLPLVTVLYGLGIVCLSAFNIDKVRHEENLRKLGEVAALADRAGIDDQAGEAPGAAGGASPLPVKA